MSNYFKAIDRFAATLARRVIARRWLVLLLSLTLALGAGFGAGKLEFSNQLPRVLLGRQPRAADV